MIDQLVCILLTILIPLKQTYDAAKFKYQDGLRLWSVYWAIFFTFKSLQWNVSSLQIIPVDFLFILIALWLYSENFKGGLYLSHAVSEFLRKTPAAQSIVNLLDQKQGSTHGKRQ